MARPITLFTGQWADLTLDDLARAGGVVRLRRPRARVLGRPLRGRPRAGRARLRRRAAASCSSATAWGAGRSATTSSARRCATRSTRATRASLAPEVWGDGDPEGVRTRAAERMKDTARAAAAFGVPVVTGFTGSAIWHQLYSFPPNDWAQVRARLRGLRRALGADHRRLRRRGRALRARGPSDRDRLRLRDHAQGAGRRSTAARASGSTSTRATSSRSSSTRRPSRPSSPTASTTSTSRTRR